MLARKSRNGLLIHLCWGAILRDLKLNSPNQCQKEISQLSRYLPKTLSISFFNRKFDTLGKPLPDVGR